MIQEQSIIGVRNLPGRSLLALAVGAILLTTAAPAGAQGKQKQRPPSMVGVDKVIEQPLQQTVPVIGRLIAARTGDVAGRVRGPVAEIHADVGDKVEKGAIIAVLVKDALEWRVRLQEAQVKRAAAAVETARIQIKIRTQGLKRLQGLRKSSAFSQARFEDANQEVIKAKSASAEAAASLLQARANLKLAQIDLYNADIRAPYSGVVSQRHTEVGAFVDVGKPVVSLIDDENLEIESDVPSKRIGGLTPGARVTFTLGKVTLPAVVRATVPRENPLSRTRTVRLTPDFSSKPANLAANQSVTVHLPAGAARTVISVHKDAVLNRKGKSMVFVVIDGAAIIRPLQLGEAVGGRFEVLRGLKVGEVVVVRGNERLRPNQKVRYRGMKGGKPGEKPGGKPGGKSSGKPGPMNKS